MQTLLLDGEAVEANAALAEVVGAVEEAFAAYERGDATMPPKAYVDLPRYDGDFRSMPAYLDAGDWDAAGVKWVNSHPKNPERHDLPTVMGTMIYSDPATAFPLAVMDGTTLTAKRTGAAAAVATDHLAVPDATSLGLVGAGTQAHTQLAAIATVRDVETVVVADRDEERVAAFVARHADRFDVRAGSVAEAAACDVVSTTTPVREPIVERGMVGPHTHVNAMGADAAGKHELADDLLLAATVVIDDYDQCTHSGEINVPYGAGVLTDDDVHAELGAVVTGAAAGRTDEDGVTVFDSTGLAIQDVAAAHVVYEHARADGAGTPFDLLGLDD
ncbi:MAG: ornithine cyclodeaminase family protein [Haloferacaceae archaeon]